MINKTTFWRQNASYEWSSGLPFVYDNWDSSEPDNYSNENCVVMLRNSPFAWHDADCAGTDYYFCEKR